MKSYQQFFAEMKRRKVFRVAARFKAILASRGLAGRVPIRASAEPE